MARHGKWLTSLYITGILFMGCGPDKPIPQQQSNPPHPPPVAPVVNAPMFNADSAYFYVNKQVAFGPRIPNTAAHDSCARWFVNQLNSWGFKTVEQNATVTAFNGNKLNINNIMARYDPESTERIALFAHWDTRPFADRDAQHPTKPFDGAVDGASGVGVLLEMARLISTAQQKPKLGIDIILLDAEDYGQPSKSMIQHREGSWCLGAQYWATNPPVPGYTARFGILLDMVGAGGATFPMEWTSLKYAPAVMNKVWNYADELGYANLFVRQRFGPITDDHVYINEIAGISCIDIIHYDVITGDFGPYHHRHSDNMDAISRDVLLAVGQVVATTVYREQ